MLDGLPPAPFSGATLRRRPSGFAHGTALRAIRKRERLRRLQKFECVQSHIYISWYPVRPPNSNIRTLEVFPKSKHSDPVKRVSDLTNELPRKRTGPKTRSDTYEGSIAY
ncbi:MAG: hypothetical protein CM1200mP22_30460 [Dehalococcoidia bacterium]|nr:MAG: hypothetical protein CM1200mP22_30460 [Dehalococcoidia bacterium]